MVSNQLLNSYFSWLSLEEAFQSLCLMLPEQRAALRFSLEASLAAGARAARRCSREQAGDPTQTKRSPWQAARRDAPAAPRAAAKSSRVGAEAAASPPQPGGRSPPGDRCRCCWAPGEPWVLLQALCWLWLCAAPRTQLPAGHPAPHARPGSAPLRPVHCCFWLHLWHPKLVGSELWLRAKPGDANTNPGAAKPQLITCES